VTEHFELRPWQRPATKFLLENPRGMLVKDPGMGKTSDVLWALDMLRMGGSNFFPALVIAPKRVAEVVWTGEQTKWDAFADLTVVKVMGDLGLRQAALKRTPIADVYVINYEMIPWLVEQFPGEKWPFKIVIGDESSRLKGHRLNKGGVRAKALSMIARYTGRWWNLTGTPSPNGLQDLWGQMWFIDFGERLKRTYTAYLEAYFLENQYTRRITTQFGADTEIHRLVADRMLVLRAEDWMDLTKPQEIPIEVELPPEALVQYRAMEKDYFLSINDRDIEAGTAMVKSTKLLQMASGAIYDGDRMTHDVHNAKIEALEDIIEQLGHEPLLVAYWWKFDAARILKAIPGARVYTGQKEEDEWNAGTIKVLLLHEQSAFGLNLHGPCRNLCFYSYYWNAELWTQMIARIGPTRQAQAGLKRVVRVWSIRTVGTIEADVVDSNERKITIEQALKRARARTTA
jgi:SNF2 family DNA or RNA helicase